MAIKKPVCCILGPTASGKTGLAVDLVQRFDMDIVSVDSALVYKHMNIGTAKPDAQVLRKAPHALIDLIEPWEVYSVSRFLDDARAEMARIHSAGRIPLLVGGTMLYFHTLWNGLSELPPADSNIRKLLEEQMQRDGPQSMHQRLAVVDETSAARISANDPQRLLRALEVYESTGRPLSQLQNKRIGADQYHFYRIGLMPVDRSILHQRIAQRFSEMLAGGFIDEVRALILDDRITDKSPSMRCVGYRQVYEYLAGRCSEAEMTDKAVAATRQLAKRQITWMRKMDHLQQFAISVGVDELINTKSFVTWMENANDAAV